MKGSPVLFDLRKLALVVLSLIIVVCVWVFLHRYFFEPARIAEGEEGALERMLLQPPPLYPLPPPGSILPSAYERVQRFQQYIRNPDEQTKQWLVRDAKRRSRAEHSLAIWGSLAITCVSIAVVLSVGLAMLRERREL